jgi:hypothetical protein
MTPNEPAPEILTFGAKYPSPTVWCQVILNQVPGGFTVATEYWQNYTDNGRSQGGGGCGGPYDDPVFTTRHDAIVAGLDAIERQWSWCHHLDLDHPVFQPYHRWSLKQRTGSLFDDLPADKSDAERLTRDRLTAALASKSNRALDAGSKSIEDSPLFGDRQGSLF